MGRWWAGLWLAAALGGCTAEDAVTETPFACVADRECVAGFTCQAGICARGEPECVADLDCPAGQVCEARQCEAPGAGRCRDASDCAGEGATCQDGRCQAPPPAGPELCNGLDDDGDGAVDEGALFEPVACPPVGQGPCERAVQAACIDGAVGCPEVEPGAPAAEICNGLDDDCNGTVDDGFDIGAPCLSGGLGECRRMGVKVCNAGGDGAVCDAQPAAPAAEACDGLDNDCDGAVDEGACEPPACEGDAECPGLQACVAGACGGLCESDAVEQPAGCCEAADDPCFERDAYCPGVARLDPCPPLRKQVFKAGVCLAAHECEGDQVVAYDEVDCNAAGGACQAGGCTPLAACAPAVCAGRGDGWPCGDGVRARCVEGVCRGWGNPLPVNNSRGGDFRVPLPEQEGVGRWTWSGSVNHDHGTNLLWHIAAEASSAAGAESWVDAQAQCQAFGLGEPLGGDGWRLPTVHEALALVGVSSGGEQPQRLVTRTLMDGEAVVVNLFAGQGRPILERQNLEAPVEFRCVHPYLERPRLPADRVDMNGVDTWADLEWLPLPAQHASVGAAIRACDGLGGGARLARLEEIIARLDARPGTTGELVDAVDPALSDVTWFAVVRADGDVFARVQLSSLTVVWAGAAPGAARALCVRPR